MSMIWFLVPAALLLGLGFLAIFIWAVKTGQFEDLETPAIRILFDDQFEDKTVKDREKLK